MNCSPYLSAAQVSVTAGQPPSYPAAEAEAESSKLCGMPASSMAAVSMQAPYMSRSCTTLAGLPALSVDVTISETL